MTAEESTTKRCPRCEGKATSIQEFCGTCGLKLNNAYNQELGDPKEPELAGRANRFLGCIIDYILVLPAQFVGKLVSMPHLDVICWAYTFVVGIINLLLLHEEGQTIGKIIMKTKIVLVKNGQNGGVWHNMILRNCCYYPFAFLSMLSSVRMAAVMVYFLVCLTDSLMIFRGDRRCMHDFIAKTRVVKA